MANRKSTKTRNLVTKFCVDLMAHAVTCDEILDPIQDALESAPFPGVDFSECQVDEVMNDPRVQEALKKLISKVIDTFQTVSEEGSG
jgi:hypothetical protein